MKHSPLPWHHNDSGSLYGKWIGYPNASKWVAELPDKCPAAPQEDEERKANIDFIVTACNSYYTLQEENKRLREALESIVSGSPEERPEDDGTCNEGDIEYRGWQQARYDMASIARAALSTDKGQP